MVPRDCAVIGREATGEAGLSENWDGDHDQEKQI